MIDLSTLSDIDLTEKLHSLAKCERENIAAVIETLREFGIKRKLHEPTPYPSLFVYCTKALGYSEDAAVMRIRVAKASGDYPSLLNRLRSGELNLTAASLLAPHLTSENHRSLLDRAKGKSRRDVEKMIARFNPEPAKREVIRHMGPPPAVPAGEPDLGLVVEAPTEVEERVRFSFTGTEELLAAVERCRRLLGKRRLEEIFPEAVSALLEKLERPARRRPSSARSRRVPFWVRQEVRKRDEGRCAFVDAQGRRCCGQDFLEFDHITPWALGGPSNDPGNVRLLCRMHNQHLGRRRFGDARRS